MDLGTDPPRLVLLSQRRLGDAPLPYEANDDRYRCLDCGEVLILRQRRHATRFTSNFGHRGGADCSAPLARQRETAEHLAGKRTIARWLRQQRIPARIEPGAYIGADGVRAFRPDVSAWPDEPNFVGIEYQRSPLDVGESAKREAAYRAFAGLQRLHLWVFSMSSAAPHYAAISSIEVAGHDGRPRKHRRIMPTRDQIELAEAGAVVAWLDPVQEWLYLPYSGTEYMLQARDDELWDHSGEHSRAEWRAGFPLDPAAQWWALAPARLSTCRLSPDRTRLLAPVAERAVRAVVADEPDRERRRRAAARQRRVQALAAHQAALEMEQDALAGRGERAIALLAERQALTEAAAHEEAAALSEAAAQQAQQESQQLYSISGALASQARKGVIGLALRGRRRSSVRNEQVQAQRAAEEAAGRVGPLQAEAAASRRAAGRAHKAGAEQRARRALAALEKDWGRRLRGAMQADVAAARQAVAGASEVLK